MTTDAKKPSNKIGALWKKVTKQTKKTFLAGEIELDGKKIKICVWPNDKGDNPRRPDFNIVLDTYDPNVAPKPSAARAATEDPFPGDGGDPDAPPDNDALPF